ncbi:MAG: methylated-DNA--[protein]-cysteine S-methyltransferase [Actinomycetota bacterium]|nr:methylated-DNA--[protein]-cysteine S-methyltransferase [Actinomycetota bacterium]
MTTQATLESPLGPLALTSDGEFLIGLGIGQRVPAPSSDAIIELATRQLEEYFAGKRTTFDLPLKAEGTAFQQSIWKALQDIPHGQTTSYGELGNAVGKPGSARAVGGAVGANPLPIVIPCHRVLASDRRITGYSGGEGIPTKEKLLDLENISYR